MYAVLFNKNGHREGFENQLLLSNTLASELNKKNREQVLFYSYDYKNELEHFNSSKKNNPLLFPQKLIIDVEKTISLNEIIFDEPQQLNEIKITATVSKEEYIEKVNALKKHIQLGDIYEINYCITFEAVNVVINPILVYQKLNAISKAPYSALAKFNKHWIICSSPELFLHKKENVLTTKPIKGTIKRGASFTEDKTNKKTLFNNHKERTENVMIVDVCRNDLSRIAKKGTVDVPLLYDIETYKQVHQMVSTINCTTKENLNLDNIITATFPMASMTGAPKIKAMDLADTFEKYNRNSYSGTLGYRETNNDVTLNVLIRSIFYNEAHNYLSFSVGSAITIASNAEDEYEECLLKAKAMMTALSNN